MDYALSILNERLYEIREAQDRCLENKNLREYDKIEYEKAAPMVRAINLIRYANNLINEL